MRSLKILIEIQKIFSELNQKDFFKKIKIDESPISIFCGIRDKDLPSLAFMTSNPPLLIESTQYIKVTQWEEMRGVYWSSFDLTEIRAKKIFYTLCSDLIGVVCRSVNESDAMMQVKNRYFIWRKMFKEASTGMSIEMYQGLYGELYFLCNILAKKVGYKNAVKAWSGAKHTAKDFSLDDMWWEIKTITTGTTEIKISSLTQLESNTKGKLVSVIVERMSEKYDNGYSSIEQLITLIMDEINEESIKEEFLDKVITYGYSAGEDFVSFPRYKVNAIRMYTVDERFQKITSKSLGISEITKVTYSLSINGLVPFLEGQDANN